MNILRRNQQTLDDFRTMTKEEQETAILLQAKTPQERLVAILVMFSSPKSQEKNHVLIKSLCILF